MTAAAPAQVRATTVRIGAAMGKTGAAALASALLAAIGTKIIAVWMGPGWVGFLGTLTQTRQTALVAATANGQTALVQGVTSRQGRESGDFLRTALALIAAATCAVAVGILVARERIAASVGLASGSGEFIAWLSVAVVLASAAGVMTALVNAFGEIGRLAKFQLAGPAATAVLAAPAAIAGTRGALVAMLVASAAVSLAAAAWSLGGYWGNVRAWVCAGRFCWTAAGQFVSISGAMAFTGAIASAGLLAVRARIIRQAGLGAAGNFDAAWAISMNQATLVLASMQTYYLPELARAPGAAARREHVTMVMRMAILVSAPVIAAIGLLKPVVISLLYSGKFSGAAELLRWTLIGDYLKVTSWVLAIPMIAAADMRAFLAADALAQAVFLGLSFALAVWRGPAQAAALGFAVSYAVNLVFCYGYVRRKLAWNFRPVAILWFAGLALVVAANR